MGVFDKFKEIVGIEDVDDDDEDDEEELEEVKKPEPSFSRPAPSFASAPKTESSFSRPEPAKVDLTRTMSGKTMEFKMVVVEPQGLDECPKLVDNLKAKKPVVINLENLDTDVARKIFDFLSGATYALNGNVQKIANNIFLFAPANVDITYNPTQKSSVSDSPVRSPWK